MTRVATAILVTVVTVVTVATIVTVVTVASVGAAGAEECTTCHADLRHDSPVHGEFDCAVCHSGMDVFPHPDDAREALRGSAACQLCHDVSDALASSVHAPLGCLDCHGAAHEIRRRSDPAAPSFPLKQPETCGVCHAGDDHRIEAYQESPHGRALLLKGLVGAPACTSCHGSHAVLPASDPSSTLSHERAPETCGACHLYVLNTWRTESQHGIAWKHDDPTGPVCTTCHPAHEPKPFTQRSELLKTPEHCGGCHNERFSTYRDSFHGKATALGFLTGAICSDCHTPHRNVSASDPRSTVSATNVATTCARCHGEVPEAFASIGLHVDSHDPNALPQVYYVSLGMTALFLAVFGLFGVHDLLWLQRALVGWLRGEFPTRAIATGPHVRRFGKTHIRIHVVVVVTFLTLAATGLPLKYHGSGWAQSVSGVLGGIEFTRVLHRFAAIVTLGYAVLHLGYLVYRAGIRRERGLFWGWRSMVPELRDLADVWNNLRYFLYLGPRPHFDRWGYWEKFDYFAVFWGIPVIGISGLFLWFPAFFTRFLPGWTINTAFVVHSEEALLALGFIFLFHFFHTHLRPESFPLDPVIFTGVMPLERFKEERPREYERLVASGELEARLAPAPSARALRVARAFGFTAVAIGLILVTAIFWSLLVY